MKQMDTMLFQHSQTMDEMKNRLNCIESGALYEPGVSGAPSELNLEQIKPALMADNEFVCGIVDNIMTNSNLSEIIEQIDTVQTESRELRELLHAQQKTMNEMNVMLLKLISQSLIQPSAVSAPVPVPASVPVPALVPALVPDAVADECDIDADECDIDADDADNNIQLEVVDK